MAKNLIEQKILDPINNFLNLKNINNMFYLQISICSLIYSLYLVKNNKIISVFLIILSYISYYKYKSLNKNENNDIFLLISLYLSLSYICLIKKIDLSNDFILILFGILTLVSFCIKNENVNLNINANKIKNKIIDLIYLNNEKIKNHHYNNFLKIFDLHLFIIVLISMILI
jgi:hypothetical protein